MGRSNINLVGNTTEGQNLGTGHEIYVGKSVGNILQYKSLQISGTTMKITCDDNTIYFSANTGGGTSYWDRSGTDLSPTNADDCLLMGDDACIHWGGSTMCIHGNTGGTEALSMSVGGVSNASISLTDDCVGILASDSVVVDSSTSIFRCPSNGNMIRVQPYNQTIRAFPVTCPLIIEGGQGSASAAGGPLTLAGGTVCNTGGADVGGNLYLCAGKSCCGAGGTICVVAGEELCTGNYSPICIIGLPAKTSETCGIYVDASGKLSTGCISGGSGGGEWSASGTTLYPTTNGCSMTLINAANSAAVCIDPSNGMMCGDNSHITLRAGIIDGNHGCNITLCGGNSNSGGNGGSITICGGFSSAGAGGSIYLCPTIGVGSTGNIRMANLPDQSTETCAVYIASNGSLAKGTVAQNATFTGGTCEYSANNVCLGGALGAGKTCLTLDATGSQEFAVQDTSTECAFICVGSYGGCASVQAGQCTSDYKMVIVPGNTSGCRMIFGRVDGVQEVGLRVHTSASKLIYGSGICIGTNSTGIQTSLTGGAGCVVGVNASGYLSVASGGGGGTPGGATTNVQFNHNGSFSGTSDMVFDGSNLTVTGDMCAADFELTSDIRCKTCVENYVPTCASVSYKQFELCDRPGIKRYGVIAQEIQEIYPEVVRGEDYLSVSYIDLLVREVAYLKNKVEELEKKIG